MNLPTTKTLESVFICLHLFVCPIYWERTGTSYLEGYLLEGSLPGELFLCLLFVFCVSLSFMSPWLGAGSTFFSLPDGLRHLCRCVIYDLEGSNDVNPQSTELSEFDMAM